MTPQRILIPVDGSKSALKAAETGAAIAHRLGATVTLLHVYDSAVVALMGLSASSGKAVDDAVERVSKAHLEAAKAQLHGTREPVMLSRIGNPAEEICLFAERGGFDLIVMGSRGASEAKGFLVGSVSAKVARHATCSVLIVR